MDDGSPGDGSPDDGSFGDTADRPRLVDVALFVAGFVLVVVGLSASSTATVVVGVVAALVGIVLPLRSLARRTREAGPGRSSTG